MTFSRCVFAAVLALVATSAAYAQAPPDAQSGSTQTVSSAAAPAQDSGDGFVDKLKDWAEDHQLAERLSGDVDGWYPRLGGMTRGSGFALGPGYLKHLFNERIRVDLSAGISTKRYKSVDAKVRWVQALDNRLEFWTDYRYEDFPQEDFWGIGPSTVDDTRTSYGFKSHDFIARGLAKPADWARVGVNLGYMRPSIGRGRDARYFSTEELFTDTDAPGLAIQPDYLQTTLFADVDTRDVRGQPRQGGLYRIAYGIWDARQDSPYDFRRLDVNATHFVPLVPSKNHVLLGRVGLAYVNNETGQRVPFYVLPYVGGIDTIRSFREFRFKDENAIWLTAEYNYRPIKWVSVAAFLDGGKIAHDWEDVNLTNLKRAYGFGLRVHTRTQMIARLDVGMGGGEGRRIFIKLGPGF